MEIIGWFWHWAVAWWPTMLAYGMAGLVIAGLVALAILAPWLNFKARIGCLIAAAIVLSHTIAFTVGIKKGSDRVKADWDWMLELEAKQGEKARSDAERAVRAEPPDSLSNDPWNRDRWEPAVVEGPKGD